MSAVDYRAEVAASRARRAAEIARLMDEARAEYAALLAPVARNSHGRPKAPKPKPQPTPKPSYTERVAAQRQRRQRTCRRCGEKFQRPRATGQPPEYCEPCKRLQIADGARARTKRNRAREAA